MKTFLSSFGQSNQTQSETTQLALFAGEEFRRFEEWLRVILAQVPSPIVFGFRVSGTNLVVNGTNLPNGTSLSINGITIIGTLTNLANIPPRQQSLVFDLSALQPTRYEFSLLNFNDSLIIN